MTIDSELDVNGCAIVPDVVDDALIASLIAEIRNRLASDCVEGGSNYSLRNLFRTVPEIRKLAGSRSVRSFVEPYIGADCFAVRAIYFDKVADANWKVPWHQDLSVALRERRDVEGFGPWSTKDGVIHAHAPVSLLERMLTVRLHLDDCDQNNGPLRVLPGSHRLGKLDTSQVAALRSQVAEVICEVKAGGALLMRPLLLHASSAARDPGHRRVIHMEYANVLLPDGLEWHDTVRAQPGASD